MIIINIVILLLFAGGYLVAKRRPVEEHRELDRKEHKLYFLYPMIDLVLMVTGIDRHLQPGKDVTDSIRAIKLTSKPEHHQRLYIKQKLAMVIAIITIFCILSLVGIASSQVHQLYEGRYIDRPEQGEGEKEVSLEVTLRNSEASSQKDGPIERRITLEVPERSYSDVELTALFEKGKKYLVEKVLGDNKDENNIYGKLFFPASIPDTGITVEWLPEDRGLVLGDGTIKNEELIEAEKTTVTAILHYEDQKTSQQFFFCIRPRIMSEEELLAKKLEAKLIEAQENSRGDSTLTLPERLEQYSLVWKEDNASEGGTILLFGFLIAALTYYLMDMELKHRMKLRRVQLLMDYPELINKLTLLVNAGMTLRQSFIKIAEDYREHRQKGTIGLHYAYEEMLTTVHELKLGISENTAFDQYGRRLGLIPYIKLSSLISQNRRKGNRGFTELLQQEALEAFEDRKEMAKRLGEEAGTKLLAPMVFLLIIVFLIIMIPAFMAFQI